MQSACCQQAQKKKKAKTKPKKKRKRASTGSTKPQKKQKTRSSKTDTKVKAVQAPKQQAQTWHQMQMCCPMCNNAFGITSSFHTYAPECPECGWTFDANTGTTKMYGEFCAKCSTVNRCVVLPARHPRGLPRAQLRTSCKCASPSTKNFLLDDIVKFPDDIEMTDALRLLWSHTSSVGLGMYQQHIKPAKEDVLDAIDTERGYIKYLHGRPIKTSIVMWPFLDCSQYNRYSDNNRMQAVVAEIHKDKHILPHADMKNGYFCANSGAQYMRNVCSTTHICLKCRKHRDDHELRFCTV